MSAPMQTAPTRSRKTLPPDEARLLVDNVARGDFADYDRIVVAFSGGKDSLACALRLLDLGCPKEKIELWHHDVDGQGERYMDWPITESYCSAVARALDLPIRYSWKVGGFRGEMMRHDTPTAPTSFDLADGTIGTVGGKGPAGTRRKFPQVAADLKVRWCSAYLKIDVCARALCNDPRFAEGRFLLVTGERREESAGRSKYQEIELHRTANRRRMVAQWRPVLDWGEQEVWDIIERHGIRPHPAYELGFGRVSCAFCIFGNADQFATARALLPKQFMRIAADEADSGLTIKRKVSLPVLADSGEDFAAQAPAELRELAASENYDVDALMGDAWSLPAGAFRECGGPT